VKHRSKDRSFRDQPDPATRADVVNLSKESGVWVFCVFRLVRLKADCRNGLSNVGIDRYPAEKAVLGRVRPAPTSSQIDGKLITDSVHLTDHQDRGFGISSESIFIA